MEAYLKIIEKRLSKERFQHSLGVAETGRKLALINGVNADDAYLAGLLHDYAKDLPEGQLLEIAQTNNLILDEVEVNEPHLLHGPVGAWLTEKELGITNKDILNAIKFHTTGCREMSKLTQIIYIADLIEPNRNFPGVESLRKSAFNNLTQGVLNGLNWSIKYVLEKDFLLHSLSIQARNWLIMSGTVK